LGLKRGGRHMSKGGGGGRSSCYKKKSLEGLRLEKKAPLKKTTLKGEKKTQSAQ